jgi:hypothetical protein
MLEAQLYKGHVPVTHFDSLHPSVCATCAWNDLWQDGQRSKHGFLHGYLYHLAYLVLLVASITPELLRIRLV